MHTPLLDQLRQLVEHTPAVLAAWTDEDDLSGTHGLSFYVAVREEDLAALYARRWSWLGSVLSLHWCQDVSVNPPRCWAFTSEGMLLHVTFETWGQVPERLRWRPQVVWDRTGRLRERWRLWTPPQRLDFSQLEALAVQGWLHLWATAVWETPVAQGVWFARAVESVVRFLSAAEGMDLVHALHAGRLTSIPQLSDILVLPLPLQERAERLAGVLAREGRRVAMAYGWQYPEGVEKAVRSTWQHRGWRVR